MVANTLTVRLVEYILPTDTLVFEVTDLEAYDDEGYPVGTYQMRIEPTVLARMFDASVENPKQFPTRDELILQLAPRNEDPSDSVWLSLTV